MRALYPVVGAGAVDVCLRAPGAAPLGIRAPCLRPNAFSCIWDQGVREFTAMHVLFPGGWNRHPVWIIA